MSSLALRSVVAVALLAVTSACQQPSAPPTLALESGDGQSAPAGARLPQPLVVSVRRPDGAAVPKVAVHFEAPESVKLDVASTTTDESGLARTGALLVGTAGPREVQVSAEGALGSPLSFTLAAVAGPAATLELVSGSGQRAPSGRTLNAPLVVRARDAYGNPSPGANITWSVRSGGGQLTGQATTGADGAAAGQATLGPMQGEHRFAATLETGAAVEFSASALPLGLYYADPPANGKLRLVQRPGSSADDLVLDLVAAQPLSGYSTGLTLPFDPSRAKLVGELGVGPALDPGQPPRVASARVTGTAQRGLLLAALSQKSSGAGAVPTDATIEPGTVLLSLRLAPVAGAAPALLFDGQAKDYSGGLRDRSGTDVVSADQVAVGRLEAR